MTIQAYAAHEAGGKLEPFEYELSSLKPDEVEIDLEYCAINCWREVYWWFAYRRSS